MKRVKAVYEEVKDKYLQRDDIKGVFYGRKVVKGKPTDTICISFHVAKKRPEIELSRKEKLPKTINNVKTDVMEINLKPLGIVPYSGDEYKYSLAPGISVGPECMLGSTRYKVGTLGTLAFDANDPSIIGILSNHHVLADKKSSENPYIVQPGGAVAYDNRIAELDLNRINLNLRGDYAFAPLDDSRPYDMAVYGTGASITSARDPVLDDIITKVGRTTGITTSKVVYFGTSTLDYSPDYNDNWYGSVTVDGFLSAPLTDPYEIIVNHGDSGSMIYCDSTKEAVGIVTGGSSAPSEIFCFSSYMTNALKDFGLCLTPAASAWSVPTVGDISAIFTPKWAVGSASVKFTLSFSPPFNMKNVCLFTSSDFIDSIDGGVVWAKRTTDSLYMAVGARSLTPTCFLGDMESSVSVSLDILVKNSNNLSLAGEYGIPLYIGQGSEIYSSGILTNEYIS